MSTTDTLHTAEELVKAGVTRRHADAHARAIDDAAEEATRDLVTRADLYRALFIQAGVIVGAVVALLRLLPPPGG